MKWESSGKKYTVIFYSDGKMEALRYGQPWQDLTGNGLILAMLQALSEPDALQAAAQPVAVVTADRSVIGETLGLRWLTNDRPPAGTQLYAATPPAGERSPEVQLDVRAAFDFIEQVAVACPAMTTCQLGSAMAQIMKAAQQSRAAIYSAPDALGNLLARIHGDGGHYRAQHGLEKAIEDAHQLVAEWRAITGGRSTPAEPTK